MTEYDIRRLIPPEHFFAQGHASLLNQESDFEEIKHMIGMIKNHHVNPPHRMKNLLNLDPNAPFTGNYSLFCPRNLTQSTVFDMANKINKIMGMLKANINDCVFEFKINIDDQDDEKYDQNIADLLSNIDIARESLTFKLGAKNTFALQCAPIEYFHYLDVLVKLFNDDF